MISDSARLVLRWSVSFVLTLLTGTARHSGHPVVVAEPVVTVPAFDAPRWLRNRLVPAADASRAPPALHA
ncbi:hypothetical protein FB565_006417 [Actinoplanes lutulentus]|uniref:Uncharacterized protein n=1 Tax=Actinoplanes lutulentus TaxID=1287878 RepID=A0A327ZAD5_9ACTN|nr:hypothetical protein [Actinoplanes lutulentus]MBB2946649.1 hypothetical protein [Actinoplanes lutulentus]RAK35543.1 hypothetical protein B0I29_10916 [Actinoplanes lutulentus]